MTRSALRKTATLSESVHRRLTKYVLAAGAAEVSLLAGTAAEAKVVYTPVHIRIGRNQHYKLDLNHDAITDYTIEHVFRAGSICGISDILDELPPRQNAVEGFPWALRRGDQISYSQTFYGYGYRGYMAAYRRYLRGGVCRTASFGFWFNVTNRYIGFLFTVNGEPHFGWARLNVICTEKEISATLTGYAYETIPGKSIRAGQTTDRDDTSLEAPNVRLTVPVLRPVTLGALAMGAPGLSIWRRPAGSQSQAK